AEPALRARRRSPARLGRAGPPAWTAVLQGRGGCPRGARDGRLSRARIGARPGPRAELRRDGPPRLLRRRHRRQGPGGPAVLALRPHHSPRIPAGRAAPNRTSTPLPGRRARRGGWERAERDLVERARRADGPAPAAGGQDATPPPAVPLSRGG